MKINGKLSTGAANPDFSGYSIVVAFQKQIDLLGDPKDPKIFKTFELRTVADSGGKFELELPAAKEIKAQVVVKILAPNGEFLTEKTLTLDLNKEVQTIELGDVEFREPFRITKAAKRTKPTFKLTVIDFEGKTKISAKQVLIWARQLGAEATQYNVILAAETDANAQFSLDVPLLIEHKGQYNERFVVPEYESVYATVEDFDDEKVPIVLDNRRLPKSAIIVVGNAANKEKNQDDCACDKEGGQCVDFTTPNRTLEEFNYFSIVRTTDPEIKGLTLNDVKPRTYLAVSNYINAQVNLVQAQQPIIAAGIIQPQRMMAMNFNPETGAALASKAATPMLNLIDAKQILAKDPDGFTPTNLMHAQMQSTVKNLASFIGALLKDIPGRSVMTANNPVDWDDEPTFFQATTIAHGHLLHFKQVWKADGYSMGDLLYSLPLAPRQRKQIAIVDWDRREDASRFEFALEAEQLDAMISRDRDINEITNAAVNEQTRGGSNANTWAAGGGIGFALGPLVIGAAGGGGGASSSAWQNSSRNASANFLNQLRDKTVQSASSVRSQRTSVVQSVRQGETMKVTTETVGNPNHCHAMTMEYFEVLRHFQISQELADVQECLFVPLMMSRFDRDKLLRWKDALKSRLRNRNLLRAFDAAERIKNNYEGSDLPLGRYADEQIEYMDGDLRITFKLVRPEDAADNSFSLAGWSFYVPFLWDSPIAIFNQFLLNAQRAERDKIFARDIAPRIAEAFVQALRFRLVTNSGSHNLFLDPTLVSEYAPNVPLYISLRAAGAPPSVLRSEVVRFEISTPYSLPMYSKTIVQSGSVRYRTKHLSEFLFRDYGILNDLTVGDPVQIPTFLNSQELRNPRNEDKELEKKLVAHLNEHLEYYHRMMWFSMDANRRFMLLDGFIAPNANGRSVASVVENRLIGIVGNCLVMPVARGFNLDPTYKNMSNDNDGVVIEEVSLLDLYQPTTPIPPMRVSVPTKGVFAEAVMGKCNSCESQESAKSWVYEDKDFDLVPTAINPVGTDSRRTDPGNLTAKDFPTPMINIQNTPAAPDPIGFGGLLTMMSNPDLFKDITGLEGNQKNALAAFQSALSTSQFFGGKAADLEMQKRLLAANNADNVMQTIQKARKDGLINEQQASGIAEQMLGNLAGAKPKPTENIASSEKVGEFLKSAAQSDKSTLKLVSKEGDSIEATKDDSKSVKMTLSPATAAMRTFGDTKDTSGKMIIAALADNVPAGSTYEWTAMPATAVQIADKAAAVTEVIAIDPGLATLTMTVKSNSGTTLKTDKMAIAVPQFFLIKEDKALFDKFLTDFQLADVKDAVIDGIRKVCEQLLLTVNVRLVWNVGHLTEAMPTQFSGAAKDKFSVVTIKNTYRSGDPADNGTVGELLESDGSTFGMNPAASVFNDTIELYPAEYANFGMQVSKTLADLVNKLKAMNMTDVRLKTLAITVFSRLMGETMAHEISHSLTARRPLFIHNDPAISNDILNAGMDRGFTQRTGIEVIDANKFPDAAASYRDGGAPLSFLTKATQQKVDAHFPVPPTFK
jgi:hypothetical protein